MPENKMHWIAQRYYLTNYEGEKISALLQSWFKQRGAGVLTLNNLHKFFSLSDVPATDDHRIYYISASPRAEFLIWLGTSDKTPRLILRYRFPILSVYATQNLPSNVSTVVEEVITPYVTECGGFVPEALSRYP